MIYRKTYRCIVEGQQEYLYLQHLAKLVKKFPEIVVKFNISEGNAYELTKTYIDYDSACLFDYDFNKTEFESNLLTCAKLNHKNKKKSEKQTSRVYHAYTNVCFDLWLVLHKKDHFASVSSNDAYVKDIIELYNLPKDSDIKSKKIIETILSQITLEDVKNAISRAKQICNRKLPSDAIKINFEKYFDNPDLSIHNFIEAVISDIPH